MNYLKSYISVVAFLAVFATLATNVSSATRELVKDTDYQQMGPKGTTNPEILEFFNYGCPACYRMENFTQKYKKNHKNTKFTLVPVGLNPSWKIYVKAYYLGSLLKVLNKSHTAMFHLLHVEKKIIKNDKELKAFFMMLGVDSSKYDKANKSFALNAQIRKSKQLARKYRIAGIPTFVANEKYKLDNQALGTTEMIEHALNELTQLTN
jgi:thiol:disulfide interchange protein DsbA